MHLFLLTPASSSLFTAGSNQENEDYQRPGKRRRQAIADEDDPKADNSCCQQYKKLLSSLDAASSRIGKEATPRFIKTLIPDINDANDAETTSTLESLHERIEEDQGVLERLLIHYYGKGMEEQFEKLESGVQEQSHSRKRGWKETIIGKVVSEGLQAEQNDEKVYALKCCRPNKRRRICYEEDIASLRGLGRDSWLLKCNHDQESKFTGVLVTKDDLYDRKSNTKRKRSQIIEYEYNPVDNFDEGEIDGQYSAYNGEQIATLWLLALCPSLTVNRNCFWRISTNCTQPIHEFGILRVDTKAIKQGKVGYNDCWDGEILDTIGAQPRQRFTLEPRESGEAMTPDRVFRRNFADLAAHWEAMGRPRRGWLLDEQLCEDFDQERWCSNLYTYWRRLHGLDKNHNIELTDWRLKELAKIEIFPNRAEVVKKVKDGLARRNQSMVDDHKQELITHKEAVLNAMDDESEDEEEEGDLFKDFM